MWTRSLHSLVKVAGYLACNEIFMLSIILIDVQCLVEYSLSFPPYTRYLLSYLDAIRYRMEIWALENITSVNIDTSITMFLYLLAITAQRSNTTVEFQLCVAFDASISQGCSISSISQGCSISLNIPGMLNIFNIFNIPGMLHAVNLLTQSDIQGPAAK